jgi:prepilin-type N-terminal cleavage/methylation domain-containing protein
MNHKGFSLIEIMVCLIIMSVLIIIAVPNLKDVKMSANETWAVTYMRNWVAAQEMYKIKDANGWYASNDINLVRAGVLSAPDPGGAEPQICGYAFEIRGGSEMGGSERTVWWEGWGSPIARGTTGRFYYYINSKDGLLRVSTSGRADQSSPPLKN